ncbi:histidine phosphatase family protein [Enterovibrio nigricans]|uniref:Probable phosphoglycerate mutase n=1 Tax=Enterovibrio nigricans DSM 22720 TaxID=1121868 RepID=A0A1T4UHJ9_9GAMM|nr:histidine phosphatase family protein [Enterovibrio nigricans]PKF49962.1 histidine phosphatase family protein [Enterovibrio nigricans]SKA52225.1 probable phosphoglycerate mutase [Enterovibrio nigricans DSM 22720]
MTVFKNTYMIMRHGQSEANVADIVVSDPKIGCVNFGLSALGKEQAKQAAIGCRDAQIDLIYCSDFMRTRETADIVAKVLALNSPIKDIRLRERYFGDYEGLSSLSYEAVWEKDALDSDQAERRVESTACVRARTLDVIADLECRHTDKVILLVSHGDALQILSSAFHHIASGLHRTLPHHETGEIKTLIRRGASKTF